MNKKEKRDVFKEVIYGRVPKRWDKQWESFNSGIPSIPKPICRYCNKKVNEKDFVITYSYWSALWFVSHKECKEYGEKKEAYECQKIDSSCNDCAYFERDLKRSGKSVYQGVCKRLNKAVKTSRNFCENRDCFVHRLDLNSDKKTD